MSITPKPGHPTQNFPRPNLSIFWEITKSPENSKESGRSCTEQCTDVRVHDSTIRQTPKKNDLNGRLSKRKPLVSKKNLNATGFKFAKDDPAGYWNMVLWTD